MNLYSKAGVYKEQRGGEERLKINGFLQHSKASRSIDFWATSTDLKPFLQTHLRPSISFEAIAILKIMNELANFTWISCNFHKNFLNKVGATSGFQISSHSYTNMRYQKALFSFSAWSSIIIKNSCSTLVISSYHPERNDMNMNMTKTENEEERKQRRGSLKTRVCHFSSYGTMRTYNREKQTDQNLRN